MLAFGDLTGLLESLVDEPLVDVLQDDGKVGRGEDLGDLATHGAGAHNGGFENEHVERSSIYRRWRVLARKRRKPTR